MTHLFFHEAPRGGSPEKIRQALLGKAIPIKGPAAQLLASGKAPRDCVAVMVEDLTATLRNQGEIAAANFWQHISGMILFHRNVCTVVD